MDPLHACHAIHSPYFILRGNTRPEKQNTKKLMKRDKYLGATRFVKRLMNQAKSLHRIIKYIMVVNDHKKLMSVVA